MAKHRTHSIAFKRQVVHEYLLGETLHGLARRHDLSRALIRICVEKYEARVAARCRPHVSPVNGSQAPYTGHCREAYHQTPGIIRYFTRA